MQSVTFFQINSYFSSAKLDQVHLADGTCILAITKKTIDPCSQNELITDIPGTGCYSKRRGPNLHLRLPIHLLSY